MTLWWRSLARPSWREPCSMDAAGRGGPTMQDAPFPRSASREARLLVIVLVTNEIASATAVRLTWEGHGVILSHDPFPPVIRRGMAFHDALFGGSRGSRWHC